MIAIARKKMFDPVLVTRLEFVPLDKLSMCSGIRPLQFLAIILLSCCNIHRGLLFSPMTSSDQAKIRW
jgi:hypothetical protein